MISASAETHYVIVWAALVFASAGVLSHSGIKIPYCTFFSHNSGKRPKEAPRHMLIAMGATATLCILIGVFPDYLYQLLPYDMKHIYFVPYSWSHVLAQLQLLGFAMLAFFMLKHIGFYVVEKKSVNLDTDWVYRIGLPKIFGFCKSIVIVFWNEIVSGTIKTQNFLLDVIQHNYRPGGRIANTQSGGVMVLWIAILLGVALFLSLFEFSVQ